MTERALRLTVLEERLAIYRLKPDERFEFPATGEFCSVTRTPDEISVVAPESAVPKNARCEWGWRCLKVHGPFDFSLTGILASLTGPLADEQVPIFAVSTFDTDYLLVRDKDLLDAVDALTRRGHRVEH